MGEVEQGVEPSDDRCGGGWDPVGEGHENCRVEADAANTEEVAPRGGPRVVARAPVGTDGGIRRSPHGQENVGFLEGFTRGGDAGGGIDRVEVREADCERRVGGDGRIAGIDAPAGEYHRATGKRSRGMAFDEEQFPTSGSIAQQDDGRGGDRGVGGAITGAARSDSRQASASIFMGAFAGAWALCARRGGANGSSNWPVSDDGIGPSMPYSAGQCFGK